MFGSITSRMYLSVMMPPCGMNAVGHLAGDARHRIADHREDHLRPRILRAAPD